MSKKALIVSGPIRRPEIRAVVKATNLDFFSLPQGDFTAWLKAVEDADILVVNYDAGMMLEAEWLTGYAMARGKAILGIGDPGWLSQESAYIVKNLADLRDALKVIAKSPPYKPWGRS